jgi:hypothetical protein
MRNLHKLQRDCHILGLTNIVFEKDRPGRACQARKQVGAPHHDMNIMTTTIPLEMFHMDLFGPVIVDDYSRRELKMCLRPRSRR